MKHDEGGEGVIFSLKSCDIIYERLHMELIYHNL